jgi:dihydrofolate synthase/folylpolyglutamate synthase
MLSRIAPLVDRWFFTGLPTPRASSAADLEAQWACLAGRKGAVAGLFDTPMAALDAAVAQAAPTDRIVVFGSFFTVGGVLLNGTPRLSAKHLSS